MAVGAGMVLKSIDPATGDVVGEVETATRSSVGQAVEAARRAQVSWGAMPATDRADVVQRFRRLLADRRTEAAGLVTRESGKPKVEAMMADVFTTLETARFLAKQAPALLASRRVPLGNPLVYDRRSTVTPEPLGVVGVVAPWNYPLSIPATGVLTALVAGNAVVLKPSEQTPLTGAWLADLLHEAGVPRGALQVVQGDGTVGGALVASDVDGVLFTGSVETGHKVHAECAPRFAPACLELGGKDPMVVLDGARAPVAQAGAAWGAFTNAGQTCAAVERLYVPTTESAGWTAGLGSAAEGLTLGHGLEPTTQMGPVIDDPAAKRILNQVKDAEKRGARIVTGGEVREDLGPRFIAPTVLADVDNDMPVMQDETFGPVLPIMGHAGTDDAVRLANDSRYGLSASVWGPRPIAEAVAARIDAGTVTVNDCLYTYAAPETPWGGWKESGVGLSHGIWGLGEVTRIRHINAGPGRSASPWYYPYDEDLEALMDGGIRFLHGGAAGKKAGPGVLRAWLKRR